MRKYFPHAPGGFLSKTSILVHFRAMKKFLGGREPPEAMKATAIGDDGERMRARRGREIRWSSAGHVTRHARDATSGGAGPLRCGPLHDVAAAAAATPPRRRRDRPGLNHIEGVIMLRC